jgi:hypothetical protein
MMPILSKVDVYVCVLAKWMYRYKVKHEDDNAQYTSIQSPLYDNLDYT